MILDEQGQRDMWLEIEIMEANNNKKCLPNLNYLILSIMTYPLIKASKAVCLWLTSCCRIAVDKAFRVPTKTAKVFALVNPV